MKVKNYGIEDKSAVIQYLFVLKGDYRYNGIKGSEILKKINSNSYGGQIIGIGLVFLLIIPIGLGLLNTMLKLQFIKGVIVFSAVVGALIELFVILMLMIELRQDRIIDTYYSANPSSEKTPQEIIDENSMSKRKNKTKNKTKNKQ